MEGERNAWDHFLATGKVEDYLSFVKSKNRETDVDKIEERTKEEKDNAGFRGSDRNGYI